MDQAKSFLTEPFFEERPWLVHGFGTKAFGERDLRAFAKARGFRVVLLDQVHSADILAVDDVPSGEARGDALATATPGLLLAVKTADCLPLFLADEERRAVAAVHAGWRGTARRIASAAVEAMAFKFGSKPERLLAALGPCIGGGCYEVGDAVTASFSGSGLPRILFPPIPGKPGKFLLDLRAANRRDLEAAGIPPGRIANADICTHCDPRFLSYRRDRCSGLRLFNFIGLLNRPGPAD